MNNKAKSNTPMEETTRALVPKLRFPEFRNGPSWTSEPMGKVYGFKGNNSLSRDQLNYEQGSVKNIHYGDIHTKFSTLFDITKERVPFINPSECLDGLRAENDCIEGDMVFADASEDLADIGKSIEIVRLNGERVVSGQHTILARPNVDSLVVGFGAYLFQSRLVRTQIQKESQGSKVLGISATRLTKIQLPIPRTKPEQQKIASCLSSVDELIAAQARKLDALQTHKKGLMQLLFPREGETQPRLRFPEFRNAGEWEDVPLGEIAEIKLGKMLDKQKHMTGRLLPYLNNLSVRWNEVNTSALPQMFFDDHELERFGLRAGDVVVCEGGEPGRAAVWDGRLPDLKFQKAIHRVRFNVPFEPKILVLHLENLAGTDQFEMLFTGGGIKHLTGETFSRLKIPLIPHAEQQRVATCLSSLDALITAETQKHEALKTHRKGLMQQLFPSPEEPNP
jgi:type I restriction enzyme, S subunit